MHKGLTVDTRTRAIEGNYNDKVRLLQVQLQHELQFSKDRLHAPESTCEIDVTSTFSCKCHLLFLAAGTLPQKIKMFFPSRFCSGAFRVARMDFGHGWPGWVLCGDSAMSQPFPSSKTCDSAQEP